MHQRWKMRAFGEKQVSRKLIAGILYVLNELKLSIYKFLVLGAKNTKSDLVRSSSSLID